MTALADRVPPTLMAPPNEERPDPERYAYWLAQACKAAREAVDAPMTSIANIAGLEKSTISLWESRGRWPRDPEGMVAAYARIVNLSDSRELWRIGFRIWIEHGRDAQITDRRTEAAPDDLEAEISRAIHQLGNGDEGS